MEKDIRPGETLAQYVGRMINLKHCLQGKGHTMLDREVTLAIIKGLPQEAKELGMFAAAGTLPLSRALDPVPGTARGVGFDTLAPWQPTASAHALPQPIRLSSFLHQLCWLVPWRRALPSTDLYHLCLAGQLYVPLKTLCRTC